MTRKLLALGCGVFVVLAACGSDGDDATRATTTAAPSSAATTAATTAPATTGPEATFPVTIDTDDGPVTIEARPTRIVSLSPTATEMLFAVGAGEQVVAVDDRSNYPEGVPTTDLSGYEPNLEAIISYEPDLVVVDDGGDVVDALEAAGVPVLIQPAATTLDDTYEQIEQVGVATGHVAEAAELVADMQADIEALLREVPEREAPLTYYHELDPLLYTATSKTFIGEVYAMAGLSNIADAADSAGTGYPQLSSEYIVDQDPDLIFLADASCCQQTPETIAARPGWASLSAVANGAVVPVDEDIASRWGPRVVDFLRIVVDATQLVPADS